jgi:LAO/AO transport system kinase
LLQHRGIGWHRVDCENAAVANDYSPIGAVDERAFIRPSPTAGTLGGVAAATREAMVIVEAAGYDVVLVETVGVGQSETAVANMTDCFLVLMLARTGDALQGIKKGVLELADVLTVNKADGPHEVEAKGAARELAKALSLLHPAGTVWVPPVLTCSAVTGVGIDEVWSQVEQHQAVMRRQGLFAERRARQQVAWMWSTVEDRLISDFRARSDVRVRSEQLEEQLRAGEVTPTAAARQLLGE